ncbi:unnamed protein product [Lupinus luteus]|uniref:Uncharacterized protein n=1 Tax=Lupinus luteus TaxID=3873 RepID=A0AAV1WL49_LUPLU
MSQSQENRSEPHCIWDSSQSTCTGVVQVPPNLPMAFSDDIVVADATAAATSSANHVLLPPSPPLPVPCKKERAWTEEEHKYVLLF